MAKKNTDTTSDNLVHILINKFLPFWPLFLGLMIIGLIGARLYLAFTVPQYESTAALIVNDENKGVDESQLMESINVFESKKIVENEIEVFYSKDLLSDVVFGLQLYAPVYESELFGDRNAFLDTPVRVKLKDPDNYNSYGQSGEVSFTYDSGKESIIIDDKEYALNTWVENPLGDGSIMFLENDRKPIIETKDYYFQLIDPRKIIKQIYDNLYVGAASKNSTVVRLAYQDPIPERGSAILEQLISAYKKASVLEQNTLATNTLDFVETRMDTVGKQLQDVERELEIYRSSEGVINLSEQGNLYLKNVGEYDRRIADINLQLSILDKVERYVVSKDKNSGIVPSTLGVDDPILSQLLQRLYDAEIEYEELSKTTAENNPIMVTLRNKIDQIRPSILENVRSQKSNLQASSGSLSSNSSKYNEALDVLPEQERKFVEIERKKKSISDLYDYLVQKREETALSYAPTAGNIRVIEKVDSTILPVSPKKSFIYLIGLFLALGSGFVYVAGKELINTNVLFRSELETFTEKPILGELAFLDQPKDQLLITRHHDIFITDQFRQILTGLDVYRSSDSVKTIMVSSSISGEGKSYVSANLAITASLSGNKTALVDMDLRKPGISAIFGLEGKTGVSDLLSGTMSAEQMQVYREDDLHVFPSGTKALNSSELIAKKDLAEFIRTLSQTYDLVILDSPPTSMVTDATLLARFCDRIIMTVRHDHTPKFVAKRLDEISRKKGFENCSVVFNGVKPRGIIKQNYGYGYGYGYETIENQEPTSLVDLLKEKFAKVRNTLT